MKIAKSNSKKAPPVVSIYDAKTQLSKLVKQAQAGKVVYIGAYGQPQAVLAPLPPQQTLAIGVWAHKRQDSAFNSQELVAPDHSLAAEFDLSADNL